MYSFAGMGDLMSNAPSDPNAVDCSGFFAWASPQCWAIGYDYYFGTPAQKAAATGALDPSAVYEPIQAPPAVGAPAPGTDPTDTTSADLLAAQVAAWQAQNQATMNQTAANIDAAGAANNLPSLSDLAGSIPTWLWAVLIGGGVLLVYGMVRR